MTVDFDKPNPFAVLRLPTGATTEQVVLRGQELGDLAATDADRRLVRWAVEALITHPATRHTYELFEVPSSGYDDDEGWTSFARGYGRNPLRAAAGGAAGAPRADAPDVVALARMLIDELLGVCEPDVAAPAAPLPRESPKPPPLGVMDVLFA